MCLHRRLLHLEEETEECSLCCWILGISVSAGWNLTIPSSVLETNKQRLPPIPVPPGNLTDEIPSYEQDYDKISSLPQCAQRHLQVCRWWIGFRRDSWKYCNRMKSSRRRAIGFHPPTNVNKWSQVAMGILQRVRPPP